MKTSRRNFIKTGLIFVPTWFVCHGGSVQLSNLDPEVYSWMGRAVANGGNYTSTSVVAQDVFLKMVRSAGIRSKCKRTNLYCGLGLGACRVPLFRDVIGVNQVDDTLVNFDESDFAEGVGLTGNGTDEVNDTDVRFSTLYDLDATNHAISYGVYVITAANHQSLSIGHFDGTNYSYLAVAYSNGNTSFSMTQNSAGPSASDGSGNGFYLGVRNSATDAKIYKNGTQLASTGSPGTLTSIGYSVYVHAANNQNSSAFEISNKTYGGYHMGIDFDATQQAALRNAWQRAMTILGRAV